MEITDQRSHSMHSQEAPIGVYKTMTREALIAVGSFYESVSLKQKSSVFNGTVCCKVVSTI